jgi:transcriptional antiterminator RfaH
MGNRWCLVQTKIRQEQVALKNLQLQGFECFLPFIRTEKLCQGSLQVVQEPLFPRYLFIRLSTPLESQSWYPIRSTMGVSQLVSFNQTPAKIDANLIDDLRVKTDSNEVQIRHVEADEQAAVPDGPIVGVDTIYQVANGEGRVMVLLNLLIKQAQMAVAPTRVRQLR